MLRPAVGPAAAASVARCRLWRLGTAVGNVATPTDSSAFSTIQPNNLHRFGKGGSIREAPDRTQFIEGSTTPCIHTRGRSNPNARVVVPRPTPKTVLRSWVSAPSDQISLPSPWIATAAPFARTRRRSHSRARRLAPARVRDKAPASAVRQGPRGVRGDVRPLLRCQNTPGDPRPRCLLLGGATSTSSWLTTRSAACPVAQQMGDFRNLVMHRRWNRARDVSKIQLTNVIRCANVGPATGANNGSNTRRVVPGHSLGALSSVPSPHSMIDAHRNEKGNHGKGKYFRPQRGPPRGESRATQPHLQWEAQIRNAQGIATEATRAVSTHGKGLRPLSSLATPTSRSGNPYQLSPGAPSDPTQTSLSGGTSCRRRPSQTILLFPPRGPGASRGIACPALPAAVLEDSVA